MRKNKFELRTKGRRGFTLIEMLVVIGIIGVLASLVLVGLGPSRQAGRDTKRISNLHQVQNLLEVSYLRDAKYPDGSAVNINTLGSNYTKVVDSDPDGSGNTRYCYIRTNSSYTVGVRLEGTQAGGASCGSLSCPGAGTMYCLSAE